MMAKTLDELQLIGAMIEGIDLEIRELEKKKYKLLHEIYEVVIKSFDK